jgi:hypothetical protein
MSFVYRIGLEVITKSYKLLVYDVHPQRARLDTELLWLQRGETIWPSVQ